MVDRQQDIESSGADLLGASQILFSPAEARASA